MSLFIANYGRKLRIETNIKRKRKVEKVVEFAKRMKKIQKEAEIVLRKAQKKMKQQADKRKKDVEEQKKYDKIMLSTKDLVFKKRPARKLVN